MFDRGTATFSRRRLIGLGVAAAATPLLAPGGRLRGQLGAAPSASGTPAVAPTIPLPQPRVLKSTNGLLDIALRATPSTVDMGAARPVTTYTFDHVVPGHTWEIAPGDRLRVNLVNELPPLDHDRHPIDLTRPHEWTTTNLHTHGLHVSSAGNGDNPFLAIPPGESFQYEIDVPVDHTGGFFWYHPHKHGAVAHQVRAGMAGGLIVRGEIDEVPEVRAAKEQLLILQAIELGDDFQLLDPIPQPSKEEAFFPRTQILYTVNGVMNPRITMYPGEVQRWRLLNAAEGKFMLLRLEEHPLHVLAWDGLTLPAPDPVDDLLMSAGNRTEILVKARTPGIYNLVLSPGSSQRPGLPGMAHATPDPSMQDSGELHTRSILTVEVVGSGPDMPLPASLPAWDPPMLPIARTREFAYTVQRADDNEFLSFGVDGEPFDPDRAPYQMKLGTAEEWTLINGVDQKLPNHAHGLHIHVNPFKITKINGEPLATPLWHDTFALSGQNGDSLTIVSNFEDFTGRFVDHCHVVAHEDLGMMEALEVVE
jgi:FtsP/CotA-like multicopper oxidase with cupredoxin domain